MFQRIVRVGPQSYNCGLIPKRCLLPGRHIESASPKFRYIGETRNYSTQRFREWSSNTKFNISQLYNIFYRQCSVVVTNQMKQFHQTVSFYKNLYRDKKLLEQFSQQIVQSCSKKKCGYLFSACLFSWQKDNITNEDCNRCIDDMEEVSHFVNHANNSQSQNLPGGWEPIINQKHLKVWRKPIKENSHLYEYRVYGTYSDVPARAFFNVQVDLDFWHEWETMALNIKVVDKHKETGSEIIHWLTKYPYPMYNREYLYVRRYKEDEKRNVLVVNARAVQHDSFPETEQYVRVKEYLSQMVIKPHTSFDENGFDYILTYFDDPQSAFPSFCYNWLASSGVPDFVNRLHKAAQKMDVKMKNGYKPKYIPCKDQSNKNNNSTTANIQNTTSVPQTQDSSHMTQFA